MRKKGIVRKMFLFSAQLIILVVILSFSVLYFVMPRYYLFKKEQTLQKNLNTLTVNLKKAGTFEACSLLISDFVEENNVTVTSFDANSMMLPEISSPFVSMRNDQDRSVFYFGSTRIEEKPNEPSFFLRISPDIAGAGEKALFVNTYAMFSTDNTISLSGKVGTALVDNVLVHGTLQPIDEAKDVMLTLIPYVLVMGVAMGLLLAWFYARQISKPILQISDAAVKMQRLEPDVISGVRSDDELGNLSRNLDTLYTLLRENIDGLRLQMDKVGRLERAKTEMMQSASHELKTPIAALSGILDGMIDNIGVYRNKEKYLLECKSQVDKLSLLVYEILNASQSDIPEDKIEHEQTEVHDLISHVLDECAIPIQKNSLRVTSEISPVVIMTNPSRLYRILSNLIGNAVRYTPAGKEILITLTRETFCIENDCGPISEEELPKLFEPFYIGSYSRDRSKKGTGLGLYIVKQNLESLGIPYNAKINGTKLKITLYFE